VQRAEREGGEIEEFRQGATCAKICCTSALCSSLSGASEVAFSAMVLSVLHIPINIQALEADRDMKESSKQANDYGLDTNVKIHTCSRSKRAKWALENTTSDQSE
jgi:hypothetical protein